MRKEVGIMFEKRNVDVLNLIETKLRMKGEEMSLG